MKAFKLFPILLTLSWLANLAVPAAAAPAPGGSPIDTSAGRQVVPAALPAAFSKLNPPDGSTQPTNPILRWAYSSGASSYQYCISTIDNNNTCSGSWASAGTNTSVILPGLSADTVFYWQVRAVNIFNQYTNANAGSWWSFTTGDMPGSFYKAAPGNNSNAQPITLNLNWGSNGSSTDTYEYCIDSTNNDTCDTTWISTGTSTGVTIGGLSPLTPYYWQARAVNSNGSIEADGGAWWTFTTATIAAWLVTNNNDSGANSLRQDLADADPGDVINFNTNYDIHLDTPLVIDKQVTIDAGSNTISVRGDTAFSSTPQVQVFSIGKDGWVSMVNLKVEHGTSATQGGGIENDGHLILTNCDIYQNTTTGGSSIGAGIYNNGILTIMNSTIDSNDTAYNGGGIFNDAGAALVLANTDISNNSALDGGGIMNYGILNVTNGNIFSNSATGASGFGGGIVNVIGNTLRITGANLHNNSAVLSGGGIYNDINASVVIKNSSFTSNSTSDPVNGSGGGIMNYGSLVVQGSTFYNDTVPDKGGGISSQSTASLAVTNSTFYGESADYGGALEIESSGTNTLTNSTIANNSASKIGGGIRAFDALTLQNTIVASNTAPSGDNCTASAGILIDGGHNLVWGDSSCPGTYADPLLGLLAYNGGPTQTMALSIGSLAIDAYTTNCPATDQRGVTRPQGFRCDIGAFELVYYPVFLPLVRR